MSDPKRRRKSPAQGFPLNSDQALVVEYIVAGYWTVLFGGPGTGKSATLQAAFRRIVDETGRNDAALVCAPSAMAAKNLCDDGIPAATIHSCFGIRVPEGDAPPVANLKPYKTIVSSIRAATWLFIDELSMVPWMLLKAIDDTCRRARAGMMVERISDPDAPPKEVIDASQVPFGGLVLVASGDLFQLPPVPTPGLPESAMSFVLSKQFQLMASERGAYEFLLQVNVRQEKGDPLLRHVTEMMEAGCISDELRNLLDSRSLTGTGRPLPPDAIYITRTNKDKDEHNAKMRQELERKTPQATIDAWPTFVAQDTPPPPPFDPKEDVIFTQRYEAHQRYLDVAKQFRTPLSIRLLPGSRVRVARNIYGRDGVIRDGVVRGALGTVIAWRQNMFEKGKAPTGDCKDGELVVTVHLDGHPGFSDIKSDPEPFYRNKICVATRIGVPLVDGYASTVDSTQSCTFHDSRGLINLERMDTSALGTAISRFKRMDQVWTVGKLPRYVRPVRGEIMEFLTNLRKKFDDLKKEKEREKEKA